MSFTKRPVRIHYERRIRFPLLLIPGGLNATISGLMRGQP